MEILNFQQSKNLLTKLFLKFGNRDLDYLEKYLTSKPINLGFMYFEKHSIPNLWFPQKPEMKYVHEVFEKVIEFDHRHSLQNIFLPKLIKFLQQEKLKDIYGAGWWKQGTKIGHRVIKFKIEELSQILKKYLEDEGYFFPADLSWIFVVTHENFSFLAGSKKFIDQFIKIMPDYKKYAPPYNFLSFP